MKKTLIILGMGVFLFSCNETAETTENETTENNAVEIEKEDDAAANNEEVETKEAPVEMVTLEDKTYQVEEFATLFDENKAGLKEQVITIEGYYMNYNKQKDANSDDEFEYNVTLYTDESFDRDAPQVFFKMKSKDGDQFKGIKQKDKITVTGKITGDEFFDAPLLEEGVVVK